MTPADSTTPNGNMLADWASWWVEARCGCKLGYLPCRHLACEHGGARRVANVVASLAVPDAASDRR